MVNYKRKKIKYKVDKLGSLYVNKNINKKRPIIYIGGQMEHRGHVLEKIGYTFDQGHNMFDGNWSYDYPILFYNKEKISALEFSNSFKKALNISKLQDIDIIAESFGGLIGAYLSTDKRIHKVYMIHSPITGTPIANPKLLRRSSFSDKFYCLLLRLIVNTKYGFQKDNYNGIDLSKVDLSKIVLIGSKLDISKEKSKLCKRLYKLIKNNTGYENDGVVIYDEDYFKKLGIKYITENDNLNHFNACSKNNLINVKKIIK